MKDEDKKRIANASRNMLFSTVCQILIAVLGLVERGIFIDHLSDQYLGLNSLFASLLSVLSISELGLGAAMAFCLYRPLAENNRQQIRSLLFFMRKAYRIIGLIIFLLGLSLLPFFQIIAKTTIPIGNVRQYYLIYLIGVSSGYLFSYSAILVEADQKQYLNTLVINFVQLVQYCIQIFILIKTQNFFLYILTFSFGPIIRYLIIHFVAIRIFPCIKGISSKDKLDKETRRVISKNTKALVLHKIGGTVIGSSDSIMISMILGMGILGIYSNYQLILLGISSGVAIIHTSMGASIGNICAIETKQKSYDWFMRINDVYSIIIGTLCTILALLLNPILSVIYPKAQQFSAITVILISMNCFFGYMRKIVLSFEDAYGLFWFDRYKPLAEIMINIVLSIILSHWFGINGIVIGTIMSNILVCSWVEPYVLFKYGFGLSAKNYIINYLRSILVFCISIFVLMKCLGQFQKNSLVSIIISGILCIGIYLLIHQLIFPEKLIKRIKGNNL